MPNVVAYNKTSGALKWTWAGPSNPGSWTYTFSDVVINSGAGSPTSLYVVIQGTKSNSSYPSCFSKEDLYTALVAFDTTTGAKKWGFAFDNWTDDLSGDTVCDISPYDICTRGRQTVSISFDTYSDAGYGNVHLHCGSLYVLKP